MFISNSINLTYTQITLLQFFNKKKDIDNRLLLIKNVPKTLLDKQTSYLLNYRFCVTQFFAINFFNRNIELKSFLINKGDLAFLEKKYNFKIFLFGKYTKEKYKNIALYERYHLFNQTFF